MLRKPWKLQKNGDLNELLFNCIRSKGVQAIKGSKVKGHATQADIDQGKSNANDVIGNQRADKAAASGIKQIPPTTVSLANWFSKRHAAYMQLARKIHNLIIEMMHANSAKRNEDQKLINPFQHATPAAQRIPIPTKLQYGTHDQARTLHLRPSPTGKHQFHKHQTTINNIRDVISNY